MLFLGPLYNILAKIYATRINHFALIKLTLLALDKTLFYFLIFAIIRLTWLLCVRRRRTIKSEAGVWVLVFYILLVLMFTTFRDSYFPWQINWHFNRPLNEINLSFLKETWKLIYAPSKVDFIYNCFGNILCFLPIGFLLPLVFSKKQTFLRVVGVGMLFSVIIETLQFFLETGVSDIDDVFFNTCGVTAGYLLFKAFKRMKNNF
ncbi:VanZ family protein [Lactobacillus kalixensis]|uniref:Glycopeptide antibiotics resistance protein n=1 Tax=Lactobacillus kalixensis DSM 16043 TaxID=1423763 RepID=A0A0R1UD86_9LACO|nr:VanZ family protein [Lactobacillus kalixensis]KRL91398.1 glycopeptide antibiotics resistance protein [Lactobacillus kalixensis DSM 16043]